MIAAEKERPDPNSLHPARYRDNASRPLRPRPPCAMRSRQDRPLQLRQCSCLQSYSAARNVAGVGRTDAASSRA
jgi:hypothetical protein